MTFPLNGYDGIRHALDGIFSSGKLPHAFMIEGSRKDCDALSKYIAGACVCEGDSPPCGNCRQCRLCDSMSNPDISFISAEESKKNISVAQIRKLRADSQIKPHAARSRVFIIQDSEKLNEQAQNALLKVLEEPPKNVVFILLTTSRTLLLPTVISRCIILSLPAGENYSDNGEDIRLIAQKFILLMFEGNEYEMLCLFRDFEKNRDFAERFFEELKIEAMLEISKNLNLKTKAKALNGLYDLSDKYLQLLKTNINLNLLFSAAVCSAKKLTEI